jgi:hypothetical protein
MLTRRAAQKALQKLAISKPDTIPETAYRRKALITKVKKPKLKMFMGKVKRSRMGLKKTFRMPNNKAAKTKTLKFSI